MAAMHPVASPAPLKTTSSLTTWNRLSRKNQLKSKVSARHQTFIVSLNKSFLLTVPKDVQRARLPRVFSDPRVQLQTLRIFLPSSSKERMVAGNDRSTSNFTKSLWLHQAFSLVKAGTPNVLQIWTRKRKQILKLISCSWAVQALLQSTILSTRDLTCQSVLVKSKIGRRFSKMRLSSGLRKSKSTLKRYTRELRNMRRSL